MTAQPDSPAVKYDTREQWLMAAVDMFRPTFDKVLAEYDDAYGVPEDLKVSVGFALGTAAENKYTRGVTYARVATIAKVPTVFMCPALDDVPQILLTLMHELIHVSDDCQSRHSGFFAEVADKLGFEKCVLEIDGKKLSLGYQSSVASDFLKMELEDMANQLGPYPHSAMDMDVLTGVTSPQRVDPSGKPIPVIGGKPGRITSGTARQTNRHIAWFCENDECPCKGYRVNVARKWALLATPICPACRMDMIEQ